MSIEHLTTYYMYDPDRMPDAPTVMHVGGDLGTARRIVERWPGARVCVVEGSTERVIAMDIVCRLPRVSVVHAALAPVNEPVVLHVYANRGGNSLYPMHTSMHGNAATLVDAEVVTGYTLRGMLDAHELRRVDLLLLNCEGAELYAMQELDASAELRGCFPHICVATHHRHYPCYLEEELLAAVDMLRQESYDVHRETHENRTEYLLLTLRGA